MLASLKWAEDRCDHYNPTPKHPASEGQSQIAHGACPTKSESKPRKGKDDNTSNIFDDDTFKTEAAKCALDPTTTSKVTTLQFKTPHCLHCPEESDHKLPQF